MLELLAALYTSIPEPIRLALVAAFGYVIKNIVDYFKGKRKDKRDDFIAITDVLQAQLKNLSDRVTESEKSLALSREETIKCESNYAELMRRYDELTSQYREVIDMNAALTTEVALLKFRIDMYETGKILPSVNENITRTD